MKKLNSRGFSHDIVLALFVIIFAIAGIAYLVASHAAPSSKNSTPPPGTVPTLTYSNQQWSLNPQLPKTCQTEDDTHVREYTGALNGTFTTTEQMCGLNTDGWTAGGEGLEATASIVGSSTPPSMTITAPTVYNGNPTNGPQTQYLAKLMGSTTAKGVTTYNYAVCFVPYYFLGSDTGTSPLNGGTYNYSISGVYSKLTYTTKNEMTEVSFQKSYCPTSEQNLGPLQAPTNVTPQAVSSSSVSLSWQGGCYESGTNSYSVGCAIYRNGIKVGTVTTNSSTYTDSGLQANSTYSYTVQQYDSYGDTPAMSSPAVTVTTLQ